MKAQKVRKTILRWDPGGASGDLEIWKSGDLEIWTSRDLGICGSRDLEIWRSGGCWKLLEISGEGQETILILKIICTTLNSRSPAPGGYIGKRYK